MPDDILTIQGLNAPSDASSEGLSEAQAQARAADELRERAATALQRGLGFVEDYGDELALMRGHVTVEVADAAACAERINARQSEDGTFPPLGFVFSGAIAAEMRDAGLAPEWRGTLETLSALADLRALETPAVERMVAALGRAQHSDGSWGAMDPTESALPEAEATERAAERRLFATGMLAGYLIRTPFVRPEVVEWAGRFLAGLFSPERVEDGQWGAIASFAHFYANGGDSELSDAALQWCGRELERGFRTHRFEAIEVLRVLSYCDAGALPGATFDVAELLVRLLDEQAGDGGFAALDLGGPPGRVGPTLDALIAMRALCQSL